MSQQSFGLRVPADARPAVRKLVSPDDARFHTSNLAFRGRMHFEIIGLPLGCSRSDIVSNFAQWKHGDQTGWAVIPLTHWVSGRAHWTVSSDSEPLSHCLCLKGSRVLIVKSDSHDMSTSRAASSKTLGSSASRARSNSRPQQTRTVPVTTSTAPEPSETRISLLESRMDALELCSSSIESQLQAGFAKILSRLDNSQQPTPRRSASDPSGETPPRSLHEGLHPKPLLFSPMPLLLPEDACLHELVCARWRGRWF